MAKEQGSYVHKHFVFFFYHSACGTVLGHHRPPKQNKQTELPEHLLYLLYLPRKDHATGLYKQTALKRSENNSTHYLKSS